MPAKFQVLSGIENSRDHRIQNLTTIDPVLSNIMSPIKIRDGRQTDRQTETGDLFLRTVGVIKGRENVKVQYLHRLRSGSKKLPVLGKGI